MSSISRRSLGIAGGLCAAVAIGFIAGRYSAPGIGDASNRVAGGSDNSGRSGSSEPPETDVSHRANAGGKASTRPLWSQEVARLYANVKPGVPTPGFATYFKDAIDRGEPYHQGCLQMMLEGMRVEDLPQALALMKAAGQQGKFRGGPGSGQQSIVWQAFWNRFGELDPIAGLAEVRSLGNLQYYGVEFAEKNIFHGWAQHDPPAAAKAFLERPDLLQQNYALQGLAYEWAKIDLQAATRWANDNLSGDLHAHAFRSMTYAVTNREGIREAVSWWQNIPDIADRKMVFSALQDIVNRRGPGISLNDRTAMITAGRDLGFRDERMEMNVATELAAEDPAAGADLFTKFPSVADPSRYEGITRVLTNWTQKDPANAGKWVKDQEKEPWYDSAAAGFATALAEKDPANAEAWAGTIQNEARRQQVMKRLLEPAPGAVK